MLLAPPCGLWWFLTGVVVRVRDQDQLQRLLVPLVAVVTDLKSLFPDAAVVGVVEGQQVIDVQQLGHKHTLTR